MFNLSRRKNTILAPRFVGYGAKKATTYYRSTKKGHKRDRAKGGGQRTTRKSCKPIRMPPLIHMARSREFKLSPHSRDAAQSWPIRPPLTQPCQATLRRQYHEGRQKSNQQPRVCIATVTTCNGCCSLQQPSQNTSTGQLQTNAFVCTKTTKQPATKGQPQQRDLSPHE